MTGPVALVGGGPGDPDLLTLRAEALLATAAIVVVDRALVGTAGLRAPRARLVVVEEGASAEEELLAAVAEVGTAAVERGRAPVVRLYRGDPWLHPAHGREAAALRTAGVAVEPVPGVAVEIGLPGLAGVPLHARPVAVTATIAGPDAAPPTDPSHTLVVAVADVAAAAGRLVPPGAPPAPAVAAAALTAAGAVWRGPLAALAGSATAGPGLLVCGAVAALDTTGGSGP